MANRYWVGDGGSWTRTDTTHWASSSGGSGGETAPTYSDDVFFDSNSFTVGGQSVTGGSGSTTGRCKTLTISGVSNSPTFDFSGDTVEVDGNATFDINATYTSSGIFEWTTSSSGTSATLTSNGATLPSFLISKGGMTFDLADDLICDQFTVRNGITFNSNNKNLTAASNIQFTQNFIPQTLQWTINLGTSTITVEGTAVTNVFQVDDGGDANSTVTLNASLATFNLYVVNSSGSLGIQLGVSGSGSTFSGSIGILNTKGRIVTFTPLSGGTPSIQNLNILKHTSSDPTSFRTASGGTITCTDFTANGETGNKITIRSTTNGSQHTISADTATCSFVNVQDSIASGYGTPFDATNNGTDNGNNINWIFSGTVSSFIPKCEIF